MHKPALNQVKKNSFDVWEINTNAFSMKHVSVPDIVQLNLHDCWSESRALFKLAKSSKGKKKLVASILQKV